MASNTRNEEIKYLFESKAIGIDEVIKLLEGTKEKSHEAATAFEFLQDHLKEIISIAAAAELALKGVEFGKESLKNAEDVEVSLSRVRALAKDASDQFGDMGEAVEKAAQAVNVSSQESAGGLAALVSQGLSAKDAIAALVPTLQLAKIANIDVGTAVGEVAAALKAFNVPAADAQKVVDELTAASHGAAGGLGAMSAAATQLAPDAKALHLSFTDVVSVLGVLNEKGIDSEKSVRGLRTVFQELQDPTSKLRGELLALGDGTSDFDKAIAALSSGSPRANQALLSITGGARTVVEALGQSGPDAIRKFSDALERQNGIAAKTAQILDDNLKGASTRFSLAIENIGEKLAKPVLEPFAKELEKLAGELNKFADSPDFEEIQKSIGDMAKNAAEAIDTLIHGIDWKTFLADGKDALGTIADKLKGVADTAGAVATGINDVFAAIGGVYHVLGTAVDGAVSSFAKAGDGITSIAEKMLALDVGGDRAARAMEGLHNAFESVGGEATEQATAHLHAAGDDLKYLAGGADKAAVATKAHGAAAAEATPKIKTQADASKEVSDAAASTVPVIIDLSEKTKQVGSESARAAEETKKFNEQLRKAESEGKAAANGTSTFSDEMRKLGIVSQQSLREAANAAEILYTKTKAASDGSVAATADVENTFLAYAKARLAATAQLDVATRESAKNDLETRAAILGIRGALADLEKQSDTSQAALTTDANRAAAALNKEAEAAGYATEQVTSLGEAAKEAGDNVKDMAGGGGESLAKLDEALANTRASFLSVSDAAAKAFDARLVSDFGQAFDSTGIGFARTIQAMNEAATETAVQLSNDRTQLQGMVENVNALGAAGSKNFGEFGNDATQASARIGDMVQSIQNGTYEVGILGQQDLAPLLQALEAAKQRTDALRAAAEQASQQLADLNQQLQDERDQQTGNATDIENRRYEKQVQQIKDLEEKADAAGKAKAEQDLQLAAQIHQQKLKDIADEEKQKDQQQNSGSGGSSGNGGAGGSGNKPSGGGSQKGSGSSGAGQPSGITHQVNIHVGGDTATLYGDQHNANLAAQVIQQLRFAKGTS